MRFLILTSIIALFSVQTIWAQNQVKFIPKIGVHFANFNEDFNDYDLDGRLGYQIGADVRFGENLYIATGVHYFQTKATLEIGNGAVLETDFDVDGLKIPLYIGIDLLQQDRLGVRAFAGPNLSLFFDDDSFLDIEDLLIEENMWGAVAGVGLDLGLITLDVYHEWALTNFFESENIKNRSNLIYFSVGILF